MPIVKVKGTPVDLGGTEYIIPPLNLRALEQLQDKLASFSGEASMQNMGVVADIAHAALLRNYPEMTRDQVAEVLDLGNMVQVMEIVMGTSGLVAASGEATGAAKA